jgi:hypothetical protein
LIIGGIGGGGGGNGTLRTITGGDGGGGGTVLFVCENVANDNNTQTINKFTFKFFIIIFLL